MRNRSLPVSLSAVFLLLLVFVSGVSAAGEGLADAEVLAGLELRSIGPALMGGRIADIAVHPDDSSTWYLAVGSGGVWKTKNAGVTWDPIFGDQAVYSTGSVTLDPSSPNVVWVGTGENVSGRHVSWGDGVYKSLDGGATWRNMGLAESQHVGKVVVHPEDGDTVWVAAEGPLWSAGGDRGLFKTTDGGETWRSVLTVDENTGVTDVEIEPGNPRVLYAATYERRRQVWSHLAGGPGSGIHKSTDGGETWRRIATGLPDGDMGKIGLAVSPADPSVVYATIEADEDNRGLYRSVDRGESWSRRNGYISNGTGPHYYQEIEASPHDVDTVYQMDVFLHVTRDGGANFEVLGDGRQKHSDNHALWIDPDDPRHLLAGTDASLYESFDDGATWRQFPNLPISQFYKLALDNSEPFYNILGGAQDLGTLFGPSRTTNAEGVRNGDWFVPLGADGYACAFDPENPSIAYMEWQVGRLQRWDRASGENLDIQPVPAPGEPPERWNWDAPLIVSPHASTRLYFASQRLWRSDDRGDSWTAVSGDLTRGRNRYELPVAGRVRSIDALYDNGAMSWYSTVSAVSESPLVEGLLYAGTDDGLVQVSEDGGATWRRAAAVRDVPELAFVNDVVASLHDADTVFAVLDAHKEGDLRPLVVESRDRGRSWRSISGDLPERGVVWSLAQDHVTPELLFAGTEFGLYVSLDGGEDWSRLAGAPTISFRDLAIQRRDDDLVGATFGRGFYVLDDYSALREIAAGALAGEAALFSVRDAWWYVPWVPGQAKGKPSLGSDDYTAPNPPFGAVISYYLEKDLETAKDARKSGESELAEEGRDVPFPGWETLRDEALEHGPKVLLTVRDAAGSPVRLIEGPAKKGIHRVSWDLRRPPPDPVSLTTPGFRPPWHSDPQGPLAPPGTYTVEMALVTGAGVRPAAEPRSFAVRPVPSFSLGEPDFGVLTAFHQETADLARRVAGAGQEIQRAEERLRHIRAALVEAPAADADLWTGLAELEAAVAGLRLKLLGDRVLGRHDEPSTPTISRRVGQVAGGTWNTRQPPTATQRDSLAIARTQFVEVGAELIELLETRLPAYEERLEAAGAPWTPGRKVALPSGRN